MDSATRRSVQAILAAIFVSSIPATIILPMLPDLGETYGISGTELGILFGIYPLMSMLVSPLWGRFSDIYGRKPAMLVSLIGGAIAFVAFGIAESFYGLLIGRALQGVAGTPRGVAFAIMGDLTSGKERTASMGRITAVMAIAFTAGPLIGALFMIDQPPAWMSAVRVWLGAPATGFDHLLPCVVGALLNVAGFFFVAAGFTETWTRRRRAGARKAQRNDESLRLGEVLRDPAMLVFVSQFLLAGLIQGSVMFAFSLWANETHNWQAWQVALSLGVTGLGFAIANAVLLKPMVAGLGTRKTVLAGSLLDTFGLVIFVLLSASGAPALIGLVLASAGSGLWSTTILGLISRVAPAEHQGSVMGFANGAGLVGRVVGPALAGYLTDTINPLAPFVLIFVSVLTVVWRAAVMLRQPEPHSD